MTEYRTILSDTILSDIRNSYTILYKKHPSHGLFTKSTIQKLLDAPEFDKSKYGPHFWSNLRKSIHRSLIDLSLFCNIASSEQLEETLFKMYADFSVGTVKVPLQHAGWEDKFKIIVTSGTYSTRLLPHIISLIFKKRLEGESEIWKIDLASRILSEIFMLYRRTGVVSSKTYDRMLDEVEDFLKIEIARLQNENK